MFEALNCDPGKGFKYTSYNTGCRDKLIWSCAFDSNVLEAQPQLHGCRVLAVSMHQNTKGQQEPYAALPSHSSESQSWLFDLLQPLTTSTATLVAPNKAPAASICMASNGSNTSSTEQYKDSLRHMAFDARKHCCPWQVVTCHYRQSKACTTVRLAML